MVHGVLAGQHFLYYQLLDDGQAFDITIQGEYVATINLTKDLFRFTCPLLDVTFVRFDGKVISELLSKQAVFLDVNKLCVRQGDAIYCVVESESGLPECLDNTIMTCWGFTIQHFVPRISALPVFVMSVNGRIEAICRKQKVGDFASSVRAPYIIYALNILLVSKFKGDYSPYGPAKKLSNDEIKELSNMRLQETSNEYVFVSPESFGVTTLWFYRSNHCWYWTPLQPISINTMDDLRACNWLQIGVGESMRVLGGSWQDCEPARRNIALITKLAETGLKYLA